MIRIIGIGPGDKYYLTSDALQKLRVATAVVGTKRQMETVDEYLRSTTYKQLYSGKLDELKDKVEQLLTKNSEVTLLASGDPSIYGIGEWIKKQFASESIKIVPGISSIQLMFSKIDIPMHDVLITSVHGRAPNWELWQHLSKVCLFTDKKWTPVNIAEKLISQGLDPVLYIGEWLSYPSERMTISRASKLQQLDYEFCVVVIDYEG